MLLCNDDAITGYHPNRWCDPLWIARVKQHDVRFQTYYDKFCSPQISCRLQCGCHFFILDVLVNKPLHCEATRDQSLFNIGSGNGRLTRYVKLRVAHAPGMPGPFSPPPRVSDPDMHHGMCMMHVPWCMSGSLTNGFLWSRCRGKLSRHSRRMRNPQSYVSGKRPMAWCKPAQIFWHDSYLGRLVLHGYKRKNVISPIAVMLCFKRPLVSYRVPFFWDKKVRSEIICGWRYSILRPEFLFTNVD